MLIYAVSRHKKKAIRIFLAHSTLNSLLIRHCLLSNHLVKSATTPLVFDWHLLSTLPSLKSLSVGRALVNDVIAGKHVWVPTLGSSLRFPLIQLSLPAQSSNVLQGLLQKEIAVENGRGS